MVDYPLELLDHFREPRNVGVLEDPDAAAFVTNPACGDTLMLHLRVQDGKITKVRWQTRGCSASIAASSVLSELVTGLTLTEAKAVGRDDIARSLGGLPPAKQHASMLATDALREALRDHASGHAGTAPSTVG